MFDPIVIEGMKSALPKYSDDLPEYVSDGTREMFKLCEKAAAPLTAELDGLKKGWAVMKRLQKEPMAVKEKDIPLDLQRRTLHFLRRCIALRAGGELGAAFSSFARDRNEEQSKARIEWEGPARRKVELALRKIGYTPEALKAAPVIWQAHPDLKALRMRFSAAALAGNPEDLRKSNAAECERLQNHLDSLSRGPFAF